MTTRAPYDIDADLGEHVTHPDEYEDWRPRNRFGGDWTLIGVCIVLMALLVAWMVTR